MSTADSIGVLDGGVQSYSVPTIILLPGWRYTIVDAEDFDRLCAYRWNYHEGGYAYRLVVANGARHSLRMHRAILGVKEGVEVDHINGNRLDNRKANLRPCTRSQNQQNRHKTKPHTSVYKGVCWDKRACCWRAVGKSGGKQK